MPNGYTSAIYEGTDDTLRGYLNRVARSMTMTIMQRDEPLDSPVRLREESTYDQERLVEATERLNELEDMTEAEVEEACEADYQARLERWNESRTKQAELRRRYEDMLSKVYAWHPPEEVQYLKKAAIENLISSMEFDCHDDEFVEKYDPEPVKLDATTWYARAKIAAGDKITHAAEQVAEEKQRVAEFNEMIQAYLDALPEEE